MIGNSRHTQAVDCNIWREIQNSQLSRDDVFHVTILLFSGTSYQPPIFKGLL